MRKSAKRSDKRNGKPRQGEKSGDVEKRKKTRLARRHVKSVKREGARNVSSERKKRKSAVAKIVNESKRSERKERRGVLAAGAKTKSARNVTGETANGIVIEIGTVIEIVIGTEGVELAADLSTATATGIGTEIVLGAEAQLPSLSSLKISRSTMTWHLRLYYKRVKR